MFKAQGYAISFLGANSHKFIEVRPSALQLHSFAVDLKMFNYIIKGSFNSPQIQMFCTVNNIDFGLLQLISNNSWEIFK